MTRNAVVNKIIKRMYGAGFPASAIMPDHMERMLQKVSRLNTNKIFMIRKKIGIHCFFIRNLPMHDGIIIAKNVKSVKLLSKIIK